LTTSIVATSSLGILYHLRIMFAGIASKNGIHPTVKTVGFLPRLL